MDRSYSDGTVRRRVRLDNSIRLDASIGRLSGGLFHLPFAEGRDWGVINFEH